MDAASLVGDVGGTHARFALIDAGAPPGAVRAAAVLPSKDHASLEDAIETYLKEHNQGMWPKEACVAVAGPVREGAVSFTNLHWRVTEKDLVRPGRFREARLINDFTATALALPALSSKEAVELGGPVPPPEFSSLAVLGPGTGFGVSALIRSADREVVVSGEGGHMSFAPTDPLELEVLKILGGRYGRVSIERLLSGAGLLDLYDALRIIRGGGEPLGDPEAVTRAALAGDGLAREAVEVFCGVLASTAGDFALAFGARGGVYLAGGVALTLRTFLEGSAFRRRFEDKGRLADFNRAIPTFLITHPHPNLLGAVRALPSRADAP